MFLQVCRKCLGSCYVNNEDGESGTIGKHDQDTREASLVPLFVCWDENGMLCHDKGFVCLGVSAREAMSLGLTDMKLNI